MEIVTPVTGSVGFYVLSFVASGGSFFLFRRLFRRLFNAEVIVVTATAVAAIVATPLLMLGLWELWSLLTKPSS